MDKALWARFGETAVTAPHAIQWLSDNGPQYTATASVLYAHELGPGKQQPRGGLRAHVQTGLDGDRRRADGVSTKTLTTSFR